MSWRVMLHVPVIPGISTQPDMGARACPWISHPYHKNDRFAAFAFPPFCLSMTEAHLPVMLVLDVLCEVHHTSRNTVTSCSCPLLCFIDFTVLSQPICNRSAWHHSVTGKLNVWGDLCTAEPTAYTYAQLYWTIFSYKSKDEQNLLYSSHMCRPLWA